MTLNLEVYVDLEVNFSLNSKGTFSQVFIFA